MQVIHIFTSITANYIPKARVLATSVKQVHPEAQFHLVLSDVLPKSIVIENEPFDSIITIEELPIPNLRSWIFKHTIVEMCTGVKPFAFQEIIRRYNCEKVIFLDPDIVVFNPLDTILDKLDYYSIVLTPHQTEPEKYKEAVVDNEICSLKHGVYNLGFLAIRNSEEGRHFLDWWSKRCLDFCYDNISEGIFTDQRWIDLAPAFFTEIFILRESGYNVATWNLTHRIATGSLEEGIFINNQPLYFYHFSGFDSGAQEIMLKKYGSSSQVLFELRKWYVEQCKKMGQSVFGQKPCVYSYFDNGELITKDQRRLYSQRFDLEQAFPNPFNASGEHSYLNWYTYTRPQELENQQQKSKELLLTLELDRELLYSKELKQNLSQVQQELLQAQVDIEQANSLIRGMESSKFWRMRTVWLTLKSLPKSSAKKFGQVLGKAQRVARSLFIKTRLKINSPSPNSIHTGLIQLSGDIVFRNQDVSQGILEISTDDKDWVPILLQSNNTFDAVINSLLLPNGKHTLYTRFINASGKEITKTHISFSVDNMGDLAEGVSKHLKSSASPLIVQGLIDSSNFPFSDCKIVPWFDRSDALEHIPQIIEKYSLPESFTSHFTDFVNLGYVSLDSFIPLELVAEANAEIDRLIADGSVSYVPESGERIEILFKKSKAVRKIWTYPAIMQIVSAIFDDTALPCQTLNFIHGSQQDVHQDIIHLTPFPEGYMCGVWIALEDISSDAGPLFAYPKSHRLPVLYAKTVGINKQDKYWNQHLRNEYEQKYLPTLKSCLSKYNLEPITYTPKAGSVFIWHAKLAHGGSQRQVSNLTRKSMVSHYFARGAVAFYDITGTVGSKHKLFA